MLRKLNLTFLLLLNLLTLAEFSELCDLSSFQRDPTLIQTNYGLVQGACHQVKINDPDHKTRTENII